jgi:hypothetical protein
MSSPAANYRKEILLHFGASRNSSPGNERISFKPSGGNEDSGALGVVLLGRTIQNIIRGSQAYYCKTITLKDEIIAVGQFLNCPEHFRFLQIEEKL